MLSNGSHDTDPKESSELVPVLPLRETVVFPLTLAPVLVGQERSLQLVGDAASGSRKLILVTQKNAERIPARPEDLYRVGTLAELQEVQQLVHGRDKTLRIAVHGVERVRILEFVRTEPYLVARVVRIPDIEDRGPKAEALTRAAKELFAKLVALAIELSDELATAIQTLPSPKHVAYFMASSAPLSIELRQQILEIDPVSAKLEKLIELIQHEMTVRQLVRKITAETATEMSRVQREIILRKQMEAIQRELGETEPEMAEAKELRERLQPIQLPDEARKEVDRELTRLERIPSASPEHGVIRTYLDWIVKLPWGKASGGPIDEARARQVLDEDHYDLVKIKDRIIEYLAVKGLREQRGTEVAPRGPESREPILCFVGPPGVGKTSLGQSIARSMGRSFSRVSLGGIHDEAEIRGHRRTYIGAMPGRILQALTRSDTANPIFMLDEVDKLGVGFHGDPSAALLEVLDPAQNHAFVDTYLGIPFDLSRVLFICTANTMDTIPLPLLDRMEVLPLAGYTDDEKRQIAGRHLLPKLLRAHALSDSDVVLGEDVILRILREYTREAGVRNLERELAGVFRKVALRIRAGETTPIQVPASMLRDYLGPQRFFDEIAERIDRPGVATGLAWTPAGGDILFVEATMMSAERERLILTGMLGNVMRESAQAALSYLRSNAARLEIDPWAFQHQLIHVHVPAGAIPKDGPSAGITILTALASLAVNRPVRNDVAMTGEITLRGKVLPVGGVKEKILAAHRSGIRTILLPHRNEGALEEIPDEVRRACQFVLVDSADDVLAAALGMEVREKREEPAPVH